MYGHFYGLARFRLKLPHTLGRRRFLFFSQNTSGPKRIFPKPEHVQLAIRTRAESDFVDLTAAAVQTFRPDRFCHAGDLLGHKNLSLKKCLFIRGCLLIHGGAELHLTGPTAGTLSHARAERKL